MWRKEIVLLATVVLVMCAGIVVGRLSIKELPPPNVVVTAPATNPASRPARVTIANLPQMLQVSVDQRKQMDQIWHDAGDRMRQLDADRRKLDDAHNHEILALFTPEQLAEYKKINDDYSKQQKDLRDAQAKATNDADTATKALLSDAQKKIYEQLRARMPVNEGGRGGRRGGMPGGPATRRTGSSTRPTTANSEGNR